MRGGPRSFSRDSSCPGLLRILPRAALFRVRGSHPLRPAFPKPFPFRAARPAQSVPRGACTAVWALPVPLAATPGIDVSFLSSGYLDVSVRRVPFRALWIGARTRGVFPRGFPHSEIRGLTDMCSSPRLIAACHVFLRPLVPRHPPCALFCLTCPPPAAVASAAGGSLLFLKSVFVGLLFGCPDTFPFLRNMYQFSFCMKFSRYGIHAGRTARWRRRDSNS